MIGRVTDQILARIDRRRRAEAVAEFCVDVAAFGAFGLHEWRKAARELAGRGFSEREIESVLRSHWPAVALEVVGKRDGVAGDLVRFVDRQSSNALARLVRDRFPNHGGRS